MDFLKDIVKEIGGDYTKLASLEEIIIQMRIREDLSDIKLTQVREYIYARTPFYRKDKKSKDVRVIVDKVEFHPESDGNLDDGDISVMGDDMVLTFYYFKDGVLVGSKRNTPRGKTLVVCDPRPW